MFVLEHHLQHLIMTLGMLIKFNLPRWSLAKQLPFGKKFRKWSIIFRRSVHFFLTFSFFVWWFSYGFSRLWLQHFKEQSKRKSKLTQQFGALAPHGRKSFCYWCYTERLKIFVFYLLLPLQKFCSLK